MRENTSFTRLLTTRVKTKTGLDFLEDVLRKLQKVSHQCIEF